MMKQLLSLASIIFVVICIGAIVAQFTPVEFLWNSFRHLIRGFVDVFNNEGALEVVSMPEGASVYIDNKFVGQTPLKKALANGAL